MPKIKSVTLENIKTGETRVIECDYRDTPDKTRLFEFGKFDKEGGRLVKQQFSTYLFCIIDVEYE